MRTIALKFTFPKLSKMNSVNSVILQILIQTITPSVKRLEDYLQRGVKVRIN
jgi:hypothetical protein